MTQASIGTIHILRNHIFDRVHRSGLSMSFFLLLRHAFRQILILDKTFMLLMSANICPMSPHVPICPHISSHVPTCPHMSPPWPPHLPKRPQMSPKVPKCPYMSPHVPKYPQMSPNIPKCAQMFSNVLKCSQMSAKCLENVSHAFRQILILDKKTGKSHLG